MLGSDFSGCAERAVQAFFAGAPRAAVRRPRRTCSRPTPDHADEARLHPPAVGLGGKAGQTLTAVLDTILDLNRQVIGATLQADAELPDRRRASAACAAAMRALDELLRGAARTSPSCRACALSGTFPVKDGKLQTATIRISGSAAAPRHGQGRHGQRRVSGTLGGRRFDVSIARVKLARAGGAAGGEWPAGRVAFPLPGLANAARTRHAAHPQRSAWLATQASAPRALG